MSPALRWSSSWPKRRTTWQTLRFGHRRFGEDVAFGKKVILSGQSIVYEPRSAVVHSHNRSPKEEGKRIFCDHDNLRKLFGIRVLPTYQDCRNAVRSGQAEFAKIVEDLDLAEDERDRLRNWADQYAKWSVWGIYLGGNADRLRRGWKGMFFPLIESYLRKGI